MYVCGVWRSVCVWCRCMTWCGMVRRAIGEYGVCGVCVLDEYLLLRKINEKF